MWLHNEKFKNQQTVVCSPAGKFTNPGAWTGLKTLPREVPSKYHKLPGAQLDPSISPIPKSVPIGQEIPVVLASVVAHEKPSQLKFRWEGVMPS